MSLILFSTLTLRAQRTERIITAIPFLTISPDSRSGALGEAGVATLPDCYSQYHNPAKYDMMPSSSMASFSYTPYLSNIVNDIFFSYLTYYKKPDQRSAIGASLTYFSVGDVSMTDARGFRQYSYRPNEFAVDLSYALKIGDHLSAGVTGRYIRSDIVDRRSNPNYKVGNAFAVDLSAYYQSPLKYRKQFANRYRLGAVISNLGPKISYTSEPSRKGQFLPTSLKLGGSYDFLFDEDNRLSAVLQLDKFLLPKAKFSPDLNGSGNPGYLIPDDGVLQGVLTSFKGFTWKELYYAMGVEYAYRDLLALRLGYRYENKDFGNRNFATFGLGFKYHRFGIDFSYLVNTAALGQQDPLQNALRFSVLFDIAGDGGL